MAITEETDIKMTGIATIAADTIVVDTTTETDSITSDYLEKRYAV